MYNMVTGSMTNLTVQSNRRCAMNEKILIVDDDPDVTHAMKTIFEVKQYQVRTAVNSKEAAKLLEQERPDLIVLDVMMDTMREGFIFDRQLKKDPNYKDIPVLMLTAVKEKTGLDFKSEAGDPDWLPVEDFLDKPVKPDVLLKTVERLLQKKNAS